MVSINILFAALLLISCMSIQATGQCVTSQIILKQGATGKTVQEKPEYQVTIATPPDCHCNVVVSLVCDGFQTVEPVPVDILMPDPGNPAFCFVNKRLPLPPSAGSVTFVYAWDTQYNFSFGSIFPKC